ncbi:hypothetical protein OWV82_013137 [Melia azedarach]|uniref:Uncharacterized protein n=1 Tax=Melia azedarach TaxID=155640 RepID=A0ACC1XUU8_MELAZ|nr:hypothetical protein OWV82_013137 [Melia azedarach]
MFGRSRFLSFPTVIGAVICGNDLKGLFVALELFRGRQYLDPRLMSTGKRNFRKRQLQRSLMQTQVSRIPLPQ